MMRLVLALATAAVGYSGPYCSQLENIYADPDIPPRYLAKYGLVNNLTMLWGAGPPSRAAAALAAAVLRAGLRYRGIYVNRGPDDLCGLAAKYNKTDGEIETGFVAHISAAWDPDKPCKAVEECDASLGDRYQECALEGARLQAVGRGAAPANLRLMARVAPALRNDKTCADIRRWDFYYNETAVRYCGFLHPDNITEYDRNVANNISLWPRVKCRREPCVAVLAVTEAQRVAEELAARVAHAKLELGPLALVPLPLESGANPRHRYLKLLRETRHSILLLDYDLGSPALDFVQPPPCPPSRFCSPALDPGISLSVIDYRGFYYYAPLIDETLQKFDPEPSDIQKILEEEANSNDTEEAACKWALENSKKFESWFPVVLNDKYKAIVFLCKGDRNLVTYKTIIEFIKQYQNNVTKFNLGIDKKIINCGNQHELNIKLKDLKQKDTFTRLAGVVVAGEGVAAAIDQANLAKLPLVAYDTTVEAQPGNMTFMATGSMHDLIISYRKFIGNWTRLAVISEETNFANKFHMDICYETGLICKNVLVSLDSIHEKLSLLRQLDTRIFIVNARADIAADIICSALRLEMTSSTKYVWILRDWLSTKLKCLKSQAMSITHFTITFSWRGGNDSVLNDGLTSLRRSLAAELSDSASASIPTIEWPPLGASLVNALLTLLNVFNKFLNDHPELRYNIHGHYVGSKFWEMFHDYKIKGVTQELHFKKSKLQNPLVFVEKWENGTERTLLAMWSVNGSQAHVLKSLSPIFKNEPPDDGTVHCITPTNGNSFKPTCLDGVWIAVFIALILASITLYLLCRARLRKLKKRDLELQREQKERRQRAVSQLAGYIVDNDDLEMHEVLGSGRFGIVRFGILKADERPRAVAVKAISERAAPGDERNFLHEAVLLASLEHRHIIQFQGICVTGEKLLVLIEHAFFGDLQRYLHTRRHLIQNARESYIEDDADNEELIHLSSLELTRLTREAASALGYLAYKKLIHRDIRAANCLVNERRTLKLADFGLSVKLDVNCESEEYICPRAVGPAAWMAPESLTLGKFSLASDVWSLGVLMLEIVTLGEYPYGSWSTHEVVRYVTDGGYPPLPQDARPQMRGLAMSCWRARPSERPTAADVVDYLAQNPDALAPALLLTLPDPRPSSTDSGYSDLR